jgi:hypothetical protein
MLMSLGVARMGEAVDKKIKELRKGEGMRRQCMKACGEAVHEGM